MKKLLLLFLCTLLMLFTYNMMAQNVGIGTTTPVTKLTVQTPTNNFGITHTDGTVRVGTYVGSSGGWLATQSFSPLYFGTGLLNGNNSAQMTLLTNGNFGIGTLNPNRKLTVRTPTSGFGIVHTDGNIEVGTYVGEGKGNIGTLSNHPLTLTSGGYSQITILTDGKTGIGTTLPTNKLQIGLMGAAGFSGNDFALGNGANALGIYQSNTATQFASSTDITLMPRINGGGVGMVGINTTTPRAPLEVMNQIDVSALSRFYSYLNSSTSNYGLYTAPNTTVANISILASGRVYATEFDAYSDARIKDIIGASNTTKDLQTLNALQITDYAMKDKVQHGNKTYKKVIAQEVEKVYPQVVSKHTDFIPNVYQLASKVEKTTDGYRLSFTNKHNISNTAKKLRVILAEGGTAEMDIVSVPSETQVIVNTKDIKGDKLFVYGEEVDDFRTVDYEGLTTLNISATQELSKLIDAQNKRIIQLEKRLKALETKK